MRQQSLREGLADLEKAGLLIRITEEKRVDELPKIMEDNPDQAVLVEKVKDCAFPFYANGYGVRQQYALALNCDAKKVGQEIAKRFQATYKPIMVDNAPCREVVYKGDDVDLDHVSSFPASPERRQCLPERHQRGQPQPGERSHRSGNLSLHVPV